MVLFAGQRVWESSDDFDKALMRMRTALELSEHMFNGVVQVRAHSRVLKPCLQVHARRKKAATDYFGLASTLPHPTSKRPLIHA